MWLWDPRHLFPGCDDSEVDPSPSTARYFVSHAPCPSRCVRHRAPDRYTRTSQECTEEEVASAHSSSLAYISVESYHGIGAGPQLILIVMRRVSPLSNLTNRSTRCCSIPSGELDPRSCTVCPNPWETSVLHCRTARYCWEKFQDTGRMNVWIAMPFPRALVLSATVPNYSQSLLCRPPRPRARHTGIL